MLVLTLVRILRDLFGLIAAIGFVLTGFAIYSAVGMSDPQREWHVGSPNWMAAASLVISLLAFAGWFFVQRKEKVLTRIGLIRRCSAMTFSNDSNTSTSIGARYR
jgi:phosphatidylserine synthase